MLTGPCSGLPRHQAALRGCGSLPEGSGPLPRPRRAGLVPSGGPPWGRGAILWGFLFFLFLDFRTRSEISAPDGAQ